MSSICTIMILLIFIALIFFRDTNKIYLEVHSQQRVNLIRSDQIFFPGQEVSQIRISSMIPSFCCFLIFSFIYFAAMFRIFRTKWPGQRIRMFMISSSLCWIENHIAVTYSSIAPLDSQNLSDWSFHQNRNTDENYQPILLLPLN